ncbi:MAG: translation initiation factor IF-2 [Bdellovibrionota bacterium]
MSQLRLYEFAKEIGVETLMLMDKLKTWKIPVKSHMATLDDDTIELIKAKLDEESRPKAGATKKVAKKKVAKKATTAKEAAPAVKKKVTATKSTGGIVKKVAEKKTVLRRKVDEQALAEERAAAEAAKAEEKAAQSTAEDQVVEGAVEAASSQAEPVKARDRGNIIGRMDLAKLKPQQRPSYNQGDRGSSQGSGMNSPTSISGGNTRNLRTGFISAPMDPYMEADFEARKKKLEEEELEKERKKKAKAEEAVATTFTATEYRKREVIFQPKKKKAPTKEAKKTQITTPAAHKRVLKIENKIRLTDFAQELGIKTAPLVSRLMKEGMMVTPNSELDFDTVAIIAPEYGFEVQNIYKSAEDILKDVAETSAPADMIVRIPVVTVMGHVDHGKTSLLDAIRKADVAAGEAGGITQHIGAYKVTLEDGKQITFIDTPGHAAFTAMRARGANVTDIVVLVVSADDGVMPQTVEALNHAKSAGVPIIVAMNKIDKPSANPEKIKQQLSEYELLPEEWGGTTIFQAVSALKKDGIKELLEHILLVAEVQELKGDPNRAASGVVIESRMDKGRGVVATVLVKNGTLKATQYMVAGGSFGRVRMMTNEKGQKLESAGPGEPVEVLGLDKVPLAGDLFDVVASEKMAEEVAKKRQEQGNELKETPNSKMTLESIFSKIQTGNVKELPIILKADVAGSAEAVKAMLEKTSTDEVKVRILHTGVGGITESDVLLAQTSTGLVIGFNVRPDGGAQSLAKQRGIEIKTYSIIYELVDDIKKALSGLLEPEYKEVILGSAEVRQTITVPKIGMIAGSHVKDGKITRNSSVRLIREGRVIYEGKLSSLKRFKDDAREVAAGYECGIGIENYNDLKVGDVIEAFEKQTIARSI